MDEMFEKMMKDGFVRQGWKELLPILDKVRALSDEEYSVLKIIVEALIEKFSKAEEEEE